MVVARRLRRRKCVQERCTNDQSDQAETTKPSRRLHCEPHASYLATTEQSIPVTLPVVYPRRDARSDRLLRLLTGEHVAPRSRRAAGESSRQTPVRMVALRCAHTLKIGSRRPRPQAIFFTKLSHSLARRVKVSLLACYHSMRMRIGMVDALEEKEERRKTSRVRAKSERRANPASRSYVRG